MGHQAYQQQSRTLANAARTALGAGLLALALTAQGAGTAATGNAGSAAPAANDTSSSAAQAQPAQAMQPMHAHSHRKAMRHAVHTNDQASAQGNQAYRRALRTCVTQSDTQRDHCLDNAIEQFGHNT